MSSETLSLVAQTVSRPRYDYSLQAIARLSVNGQVVAEQFTPAPKEKMQERGLTLPVAMAEQLIATLTGPNLNCHATARKLLGRTGIPYAPSFKPDDFPVTNLPLWGLGAVVDVAQKNIGHSVVGLGELAETSPECVHRPLASSLVGFTPISELIGFYDRYFKAANPQSAAALFSAQIIR